MEFDPDCVIKALQKEVTAGAWGNAASLFTDFADRLPRDVRSELVIKPLQHARRLANKRCAKCQNEQKCCRCKKSTCDLESSPKRFKSADADPRNEESRESESSKDRKVVILEDDSSSSSSDDDSASFPIGDGKFLFLLIYFLTFVNI